MANVEFNKIDDKPKGESLTLQKQKLECVVRVFSGKSGDFWVSIIPSLNTSGYGDTEEDSFSDLQYNLKVFSDDFFKLNQLQKESTLRNLGWTKKRYFSKQFANSYIDEKGVLQNFDNPLEVKSSFLEAV